MTKCLSVFARLLFSVLYRISSNYCAIFYGHIEWFKLNGKVLYHFMDFPIINKKIN